MASEQGNLVDGHVSLCQVHVSLPASSTMYPKRQWWASVRIHLNPTPPSVPEQARSCCLYVQTRRYTTRTLCQ
jgi:hypothetical protein